MEYKPKTTFIVRCSFEQWKEVSKYCIDSGKSKNEWILEAIKDKLKKEKENKIE